jgi:aryl-alcohol dehydrogenase-like predicted oxidoreductase
METLAFGRTGHESSRVIFGAAALGAMRQEKADQILQLLLDHGVNHIDTAASYGDSELRVGPWMERHRDRFFLATKTGDRTADGAQASVRRSLERLRVERVDLVQLHNLVDEREWETALGPGGALEALVEARARGQVRFIGVTGHGTRAPEMHRRSLERFPFDSVLVPYNFTMLGNAEYASDLEALLALCRERGVAVQTIKSVARRRWPEARPEARQGEGQRRFSWYEPLTDPDAIARAVQFVLGRPGLFLNSSSDATLLRHILDAASRPARIPSSAALVKDVEHYAIEPLFVRDVAEGL